jgi:signal transduction histidine kinase/HAMP domain-containing protein
VTRKGGRLSRKYVIALVALVTGALLASGAVQIYGSYNESKAALVALQYEKARGAASRIETFVKEIERSLGWTTQPQLVGSAAALDQRRQDSIRLLRQVLAVTELSQLDAAGREQLRISRLAMDVVGSQTDYSQDARFREAKAGRTFFGPVYFRKESEPYMTISLPQSGGGVTVAEVNLKFIWDVVSQIKVGKAGLAYVVDRTGALIAHPDISLVLQKTTLDHLEQVKAALTEGRGEVTIARDSKGREVLTAHAAIAPLGWVVFVEQPLEEAFEPLRASARRTGLLVVAGIVLSVVVSALLARRMARPIQVLQESAAKIGAGDLGHRIQLRSGDELETLADEFNQMTGRLRESHATLEQKVEDRTRELTEALEQQTATAEILRVISSSPTDIQPVMDALAESAARLCGAQNAQIFRAEGGTMRLEARYGPVRASLEPGQYRSVTRASPSGRAMLDGVTMHIPDLLAEGSDGYPDVASAIRREGIRTTVAVPMLREGVAIGAITAYRTEVRPFSDKQIALLQTFADQAVIAIENVRLFKELEEKNRTITAALEQQTATAEILRVISSSPTDIQPVMAAVAESAARLTDASQALIGQVVDAENFVWLSSSDGPVTPRRYPITRAVPSGRAMLDRETTQEADLSRLVEELPYLAGVTRVDRVRTCLATPLLREGSAVGVLLVYRTEVRPFTDKQTALLQTFADQAVIAIENVRLFRELEEKNRAVTEALEQQTATSDILRVISSTPTDEQPVFDAIVRSARRLCDATFSVVFLTEAGQLTLAAVEGVDAAGISALHGAYPRPIARDTTSGRAVLDRRLVHLEDSWLDPEYTHPLRDTIALRSILTVPILREGLPIGALSVWRGEVRPFTDKQIALLQTFADQAVIAIENVRLFKELEASTAELTRSVGELKALSEVGRAISSTLDFETVLATIVSRANELAETDGGAIYEFDAATRAFRLRATDRFPEEFAAILRATTLVYGEGAIGRAAMTREPIQVPDVTDPDAYSSRIRDALVRAGYRSLLAVPLVSEDEVVGALVVNRRAAGAFADGTVELLRTFATQSALAIQNARLFSEIEDKSRQLEEANQHKSEFLASVSHELRTPLNAIIGFSEVMLERLFGEVNEKQEEYLNDILSSGRHLLSLINDILDLAKIEAGRMELERGDFDLPQAIDNTLILVRERALRRGIALERWVDPRLGEISGDERKIKQVLLNLLSNAVKFTPEGGRIEVRAVLADGTAEVSVSDTGVGIAPEDHEAVFEEFRQVGTDYARKHEGTGLGLALARRFVELHGGRIWVKSQVGHGSTFTFAIPMRPTWQAS